MFGDGSEGCLLIVDALVADDLVRAVSRGMPEGADALEPIAEPSRAARLIVFALKLFGHV